MLLTKEQILARRFKTERIVLSDGGEVIVRALPLHIIERAASIDAPGYGSEAFVFVNAIVDEKGDRIYADTDAEQIAQGIDLELLQLVVSKAYSLTRIDDAVKAEVKKNWNHLNGSDSGEPLSPSAIPTPT